MMYITYIKPYNLPWETIFVSKDKANFHIDMLISLVFNITKINNEDGGLSKAVMDNWEDRMWLIIAFPNSQWKYYTDVKKNHLWMQLLREFVVK